MYSHVSTHVLSCTGSYILMRACITAKKIKFQSLSSPLIYTIILKKANQNQIVQQLIKAGTQKCSKAAVPNCLPVTWLLHGCVGQMQRCLVFITRNLQITMLATMVFFSNFNFRLGLTIVKCFYF